MRTTANKVIIDTNLWISFLISNKLKWVDNLIFKHGIRLIFSQELLDEFVQVTQRPKFLKYFDDSDVEQLLKFLDKYGELVIVNSTIDICRDFKDNFLLSLSVDSKADYWVTGDKDLLDLGKINKTKIITIAEFERKFK